MIRIFKTKTELQEEANVGDVEIMTTREEVENAIRKLKTRRHRAQR